MNATDQLRAEHDGILKMLQILETLAKRIAAGEPVEFSHIDRIVEFLQVFADQCHHGKEETLLFPALEQAGIPRQGGPIGVMLSEHDHGRNFIAAMKKAAAQLVEGDAAGGPAFVAAARGYIDLLRNHIDKENNVLFGMADRSLSQAQQDQLYAEFENLERERIGEGRHEAYHALLDELAGTYLDA